MYVTQLESNGDVEISLIEHSIHTSLPPDVALFSQKRSEWNRGREEEEGVEEGNQQNAPPYPLTLHRLNALFEIENVFVTLLLVFAYIAPPFPLLHEHDSNVRLERVTDC